MSSSALAVVRRSPVNVIAVLGLALLFGVLASLTLGSNPITPAQVVQALVNPASDTGVYSLENAGKTMSGDVILLSVEGFQTEDLKKQATFAKHPALVADQVYPNPYTSMDYSSQAKVMDQLATVLGQAKNV